MNRLITAHVAKVMFSHMCVIHSVHWRGVGWLGQEGGWPGQKGRGWMSHSNPPPNTHPSPSQHLPYHHTHPPFTTPPLTTPAPSLSQHLPLPFTTPKPWLSQHLPLPFTTPTTPFHNTHPLFTTPTPLLQHLPPIHNTPPPREYGQCTVGTHPTGMHTCFSKKFI